MNKIHMRQLIDHIKALPPEQFKMSTWGAPGSCGTVACLAGHAVICMGRDPLDLGPETIKGLAADWLGLGWYEARSLFQPIERILDEATAADGVAVMERFMDVGDVNWEAVL